MLSYDTVNNEEVFLVESVGRLTIADYQAVMPKLLVEARSHKSRKLLLDHRKHDGWASKAAQSISLDAWREARDLFDKIAYVAPDGKQSMELIEYLKDAGKEFRRFSPLQYNDALTWLMHS